MQAKRFVFRALHTKGGVGTILVFAARLGGCGEGNAAELFANVGQGTGTSRCLTLSFDTEVFAVAGVAIFVGSATLGVLQVAIFATNALKAGGVGLAEVRDGVAILGEADTDLRAFVVDLDALFTGAASRFFGVADASAEAALAVVEAT